MAPYPIAHSDVLYFFVACTSDELVNFDGNVPEEITIGDKSLTEKVKLIALLDEDEKNVVFKMIDAFLTKKKFKEFFEQQLAS
ncbi:transcriptional regulator [Microscilla marina]|uniref:transcriptional regulator n=1 Tax=Microscilla marina TaxID=1027 RepID=UPI00031C9659|nr:transcriptional regulator [Microscilla marina]